MTYPTAAELRSRAIADIKAECETKQLEAMMVGNTPPGCDGANFPDKAPRRDLELEETLVSIVRTPVELTPYQQRVQLNCELSSCRWHLASAQKLCAKLHDPIERAFLTTDVNAALDAIVAAIARLS